MDLLRSCLAVASLVVATGRFAAADTYIAEPGTFVEGYVETAPTKLWLPHGLLDRMRLAPFHMSATTEVGTLDGADTATTTLHAQMSTECSCNIGIYGTLPASIGLGAQDQRQYAPGARLVTPDEARSQLGTLDVGLFGGTGRGGDGWIYRIGTVLPTAPREPAHPMLPSARVGDRVLELPRSAGVRLSTSKVFGMKRLPRMCDELRAGFRIDGGIDIASVLAEPGNAVHTIPRAGAGMMMTLGGAMTYSVDTALSLDPFVNANTNLRWSTGVTARYARADGRNSIIQPALTIATTRTELGWGASVLVDLTASAPMHASFGD